MDFESSADRVFEIGKVVLHRISNCLIVETIVGVSQDISHASNLAPIRAGAQVLVFRLQAVSGYCKDLKFAFYVGPGFLSWA